MMVETIYGPLSTLVLEKAKQIRLLICDVDGVLSDGRIYMGNQGEELKTFHVHDGFGLKALRSAGIEVAIITGRRSQIVEQRMSALGISHVYQGQENKCIAFQQLCHDLNLREDQVAYIGDDVIDLPVMQQCGLSVAVANAHPAVKLKADYITTQRGGEGAVRELCDQILLAYGVLEQAMESSI